MAQPTNDPSALEIAKKNRQIVERYFLAMEAQDYDVIREIFAPEGKQLMPYAPEGYQHSVEGIEAVYKQFSELPSRFTYFRYARRIYTTDDPNFVFVKFTGDLGLRSGGTYENEYVGTFRLENEKILEFTEYFNPFIMAKAFDVAL